MNNFENCCDNSWMSACWRRGRLRRVYEAIGNKDHEYYRKRKEWGKSQKFEQFDVVKVNRELQKSLKRKRL